LHKFALKGTLNSKHQIIRDFDSNLESQKSSGEINYKSKEDGFQVDENETLKSLVINSVKRIRI